MMRLSPAMTWSRHGDDIFVHGERQVLKLPDCAPEVDAMMRLLEAGCDASAISAIDPQPERTAEILEWLRTTNCLVQNDSRSWVGTPAERQADYFSALGANPDEAQMIIGKAHVAILGVGGIGAVVLTHLVSAGVNRYTLIDGDVVQSHNLNRQFIYGLADVGRSKVDAAADWIGSRNPSADVRCEPRMLTGREELTSVLSQDITLLVVAADSPSDIGLHAAYACLEAGTAMVGADCGLRTASWGPLLEPADIPAYVAELETALAALPVPLATRPMTASFGPTNAIAASYLAKDVLHWLAGLPAASHRRKVVIDLDSGTIDAQGAGLRARTENA